MRLLGMVEFGTNHRITLPKKAVEILKMKEGDILVFYEDGGSLVIKLEKG